MQHQGDLQIHKACQNKDICLQPGGIQEGKDGVILLQQEMKALIAQKENQIVADDDVQQILFFLPEGKIEGDGFLQGNVFRQVSGQMQNAGAEFPADDCPEAAVLVGKVVVKGFPGNAQLVADVRDADRSIGPLQKVVKQTFLDLFLTTVGGGRSGNLDMIHILLHSGVKFKFYLQIQILYRKSFHPSIPGIFSNLSKNKS